MVDELEVAIPTLNERSDTELAQAVVRALEWHNLVPLEKTKVTVQNGWLALEGQVEWHYLREGDVNERIEAALARSAQLEAEHVSVRVNGGKVVLNGQVRTWLARAGAERAVPGVDQVDNQPHIVISR